VNPSQDDPPAILPWNFDGEYLLLREFRFALDGNEDEMDLDFVRDLCRRIGAGVGEDDEEEEGSATP